MQSERPAAAPADDFDKAIASLRDLVASTRREGPGSPHGEDLSEGIRAAAGGAEPQPSGSGGSGGYFSGAHEYQSGMGGGFGGGGGGGGGGSTGGPSQPFESAALGQGRQPRLTDILATGIHEATQHVSELIDANRAAHAHLFGPLSLPARPGGPRPASAVTADGHLAGAMWQLRESIKELQAVSNALLTRI